MEFTVFLAQKIHDKLQEIIEGTATESELPDVLNQELLDLEMLGIEFPVKISREMTRSEIIGLPT